MPKLNARAATSRVPRDSRTLRKREDPPQAAEIADLRHEATARKRQLLNMLKVENAAKHLGHLPDEGCSLHVIMRGNFAFGDIIPATIKLIAPETLTYLAVTTLGFSKWAAVQLTRLIDTGQIRTIDFLCADFFEKASPEVAVLMRGGLTNRGSRFAAARCHAKIVLMETTDGRYFVSEGSANIRACRAIEQFAMFQDRQLFEFHREWIQDLIGKYTPPKDE